MLQRGAAAVVVGGREGGQAVTAAGGGCVQAAQLPMQLDLWRRRGTANGKRKE